MTESTGLTFSAPTETLTWAHVEIGLHKFAEHVAAHSGTQGRPPRLSLGKYRTWRSNLTPEARDGIPSDKTIRLRFGGWNNVLERFGYQQEPAPRQTYTRVSSATAIQALNRWLDFLQATEQLPRNGTWWVETPSALEVHVAVRAIAGVKQADGKRWETKAIPVECLGRDQYEMWSQMCFPPNAPSYSVLVRDAGSWHEVKVLVMRLLRDRDEAPDWVVRNEDVDSGG